MTNEVLDLIGKWSLLAALPPALFFVISYMLRAPWWRSLIGVMFVLLSATIIGLVTIVSLSLFLGLDYPGRYHLRAIVYGLVAVTMYFLAITYETERRSPAPAIPFRKDRTMTDPTPQHAAPTLGDKIAEYRKAIAGLLVPALVVLGASLFAGSDGGTAVTLAEWVTIAIAALGTSSVVAGVTNRPLS